MYTYSVVIPTLNEENRIRDLVNIINSQSVKPNEIIIADKSTDKTPAIAKELGVKIAQGVNDFFLGRAKNNGAKLATGDVIFFFDADIKLPDKTYIQYFLEQFEKQGLGAAHAIMVPEEPNLLNTTGYFFYNIVRKLGPVFRTTFSDVCSGIAVTKKAFDDIGGFRDDIRNSDDILFLTSIQKAGYKYRILDKNLFVSDRRVRNKSIFIMILLTLMSPIEILLKKRGYGSTNRFIDIYEKIYQMNKFDIKKLKEGYKYLRA